MPLYYPGAPFCGGFRYDRRPRGLLSPEPHQCACQTCPRSFATGASPRPLAGRALMKYRRMGATGPLVSAIGLGFWSIGGGFGGADATESRRTIARALDLGVTLFDTAPAYGSAEEFLGGLLSPADRARVFLTTKCGLAPDPISGRMVLDSRPQALRSTFRQACADCAVTRSTCC